MKTFNLSTLEDTLSYLRTQGVDDEWYYVYFRSKRYKLHRGDFKDTWYVRRFWRWWKVECPLPIDI